MRGCEMARRTELGLHLDEFCSLDDLDRKAGRPDVVSPTMTAAAHGVIGDGDLRQLLRSEYAATNQLREPAQRRTHPQGCVLSTSSYGGSKVHWPTLDH